MTGLTWDLAGYIVLFQVLQAVVAGALIAVLLWYGKRASARRERTRG